jgi:hypothetical protein
VKDDGVARTDDDREAVSLFIFLMVFLTSHAIASGYGLGFWASLAGGVVASALGALAHRRWVTRGRQGGSLGDSH